MGVVYSGALCCLEKNRDKDAEPAQKPTVKAVPASTKFNEGTSRPLPMTGSASRDEKLSPKVQKETAKVEHDETRSTRSTQSTPPTSSRGLRPRNTYNADKSRVHGHLEKSDLSAGLPSANHGVLEACWMTNVPKMDALSESDPFLTAWVEREGRAVGTKRVFPFVLNGRDPVFLYKRALDAPMALADGAQATDELVITVDDFDDAITTYVCGVDKIGSVRIPISEIDAAQGKEIIKELVLTEEALSAESSRQAERSRQLERLDKHTALGLHSHARRSPRGETSSRGVHAEEGADDSEREILPSCKLCVRAWPSALRTWPEKKWVFLIRHGQSMWNLAEKNMDIGELVTHTDHGLSLEGLQQASALASRILSKASQPVGGLEKTDPIKDAKTAPEHVYDKFLSADRIFASPLTRAVETALVTLQHHPTSTKCGVALRAELREVKNMLGRDTIGEVRGTHICPHVHKKLASLYHEHGSAEAGTDAEALKRIKSIPVHAGNTSHDWWDELKETDEQVDARVTELLYQLKMSPDERIILVGHSLMFRHLCSMQLICGAWCSGQQETLQTLAMKKIGNCGCVALHLDFGASSLQSCIDEAYLLFDTQL